MTPECTSACCSQQHGSQITAAIVRGTEVQAIAYMKNLCRHCYFVTDKSGKSALHTAASCGKRKVVRWLLAQGASLNQPDIESGYTPLHRALFYGHLHVACALIEAGANIFVHDNDALTPFDHVNIDRPSYVAFSQSLPTHLYVWGSNNNYNLGFISRNAKETPDCLDTLQREGLMIKDVVMEKFHTLFLTTKGQVYVCGHGNGGRLGLANHATVMTPRMIKTFAHVTITKVSVGTDHSLFLSESGQVWSCGTNRYHQLGTNPPVEELNVPQVLAWHKTHKDECIEGIGAGRYHSVMWTSKSLYTFGLNGGQIGQMKNQMEPTIVMPRMVTSISLKEKGHITCAAVSDGATVVCTSFGDVYLLYQYQTRRIGFKMHNILRVACVGGWLDSNLIVEKRTEKNSCDLKILVLTSEGNNNLYLWTESLSQMTRCLYDIDREISVVDVCLSTHMIGVVTKEGEAFAAEIVPPNKQSSPGKPFKRSSSQLVKFLDRSTCVFLHLTRIAGLHRAISIKCDPKGLNFAAIQNEPKSYLTDLPEVGPSSFKKDLTTLFLDTNEMDSICDVVISCDTKNFFAHSFILACHSQYFKDKLLNNCPKENVKYTSTYMGLPGEKAKKIIAIPDVDPEIFQEILTYMYTGSCQLLIEESERILNGDDNSCFGKKTTQEKENFSVLHEDKHSNKNKKKRKQRLSESKYPDENSSMQGPINSILTAARTYGIKALEKDIKNMLNLNGSFIINDREKRDDDGKFLYSRKACQELWDVIITSGTGDKLGAHKCILSARLEYFNCMFGACWIEATSSKSLSMPLPTNVLAIILDYLYEDDSVKLRQCREPEFICNVLAVAEQFLMNRLREICEVILAGLITLKNAAELLEFACTYRANQLKKTVMEFICLNISAILENGSLLTITSSDVLLELSLYYRKFISQISYRVLTPHDEPPYANELEKLLEQNPYVLPGSDDEWEDESLTKDKHNRSNSQSSSRKIKRKHRNSQGEMRTRKTSTSSQLSVGSSSDCDSLKDLEQEFEALDFDDLEERSPEDIGKALQHSEKQASNSELIIPKEKIKHRKNGNDNASWQKVGKKKNESVQLSHEEIVIKENSKKEINPTDLLQSETVSQTQPIPVSPKVEASPRNEFPSLSDSFSFSPRNSSAPRSSKMGKKSEKQWKKVNLNELDQIDAVEEIAKKKASGATSPSVQLPAWGAKKDVSNVHNLADIMKSEEASVKVKHRQTSAPIPIQKGKNSSQMITPVKTPTPVKKGWGVADPIPDQRKRLDSEGNGPGSLNATSPPTSPLANNSLTSPGHSFCEEAEFSPRKKGFRVPNFSNILHEEQIRKVNLKRERQKTLGQIQIEDRAIEELLMFYGAAESIDEKITVRRMRTVVGNPVWK